MIYRFVYKKYRRSFGAPLRTVHGPWREREGIIVRLERENGRVGFGEIAPIPWFGTETLAEGEERCRGFGDKVSDEVLDAVPERMGCVRFALAQARAAASEAADPANAASVKPVRLPVAALLPAGRAALTVLKEKIEGGFLAFKWKVGVGEIADELALLDDLLARLPAHAKLRLDANGAWTSRQAVRWLERCADRPVEFVEQPVTAGDEDALLGLAEDYPVKLALDESVVRLSEARHWQALGWRGVFVIKPALSGPLEELVRWVSDTKADIVLSSAIETTLARSAILRVVLGGGLTQRALGFGVGEIFGERVWDGPVIGPLADASCIQQEPGEALWNALA
ncbi:o-succinylbenzoate synthase [Oleiharenicola lentus]|uniref:o-succinylbenzoate synthase n=1 Tax=Oleiharenicola lentus TaxID=2508720 RepID=UPI003F66F56A